MALVNLMPFLCYNYIVGERMIYLIINITIVLIILVLNIILYVRRIDKKKLVKNKTYNYAVLIPARYESKVIKNTLKYIKHQNKNMDNVYVIIESKDDPTFNIAKKIGANVFIRKKPIKHSKGYALDECLKSILNKKINYDLYFIMDADNVIGKSFFKNMKKYRLEGYEVASAYRNTSNPYKAISICSGFLFSMQSNLYNKYREIFNQPITLSGSGYYISGKIIEDYNGFPFYSLTEDFEFSICMEDDNISNIYAEDCVYYDEQPTSLKDSIKQRIRWLRGIFDNTKKRKKSASIVISNIILNMVTLLIILIIMELFIFFGIILGIVYTYLLTSLITLICLIIDRNKFNISIVQKIKCIIYNPIFLFSYIICLFALFFRKKILWDKTIHKGNE